MLQDYLKELSHVQLLKKHEEMDLWGRYKDQDDLTARRALIEAYQPLVFKLVMKMQPKEDLILDLIQEASIGLIEAVERFDYKKGIAFPSYASFRIRGQIINFFQKINFDIVSLDQTYPSSEDENVDPYKYYLIFSKITKRIPWILTKTGLGPYIIKINIHI